MREIYALIQEIVKLINDSMGLTILVYITSLVISQINIIYNLLLILIGDYPAEYTCCKFHTSFIFNLKLKNLIKNIKFDKKSYFLQLNSK